MMATEDVAVVTAPTVGGRTPASKGQAKTMQAMAAGVASNAYRHFEEDDSDESFSIDDGINMDESLDMSERDQDEEPEAMPSREDVAREFEEYLERIQQRLRRMTTHREELMAPLSEQAEDDLRNKSMEEKWKIVCNEKQRDKFCLVSKYIASLQNHLNLRKKRVSQKKISKQGLESLAFWLAKLKQDLKLADESFALEFVSDEHSGIGVLTNVLKQILLDQNATLTTKKSKMEVHKQCQEGTDQLVKCPQAVETIAQCTSEQSTKTKVVALELLTVACNRPDGHRQVLAAFNDLHVKRAESVPFKGLVAALSSPGSIRFQTTCVRFFNKLVTEVDNGNTRIYLQQQLKMAGFDPDDLDRYFPGQEGGVESECLQQELDTWRRNCVSLSSSRQDVVDLEARNIALRQEVDRLQLQISDFDKEKERRDKKERDLNEQCQQMRDRAAELQDVIDKLHHLLEEKAGIDAEKENINVEHALSALDKYPTMRGLNASLTNASESVSPTSPEPAEQREQTDSGQQLPPIPRAPPTPSLLSTTVRRKITMRSGARLPLLHWIPLYSVKHTIFEGIDESMLKVVDFTDFVKRFELPSKIEGEESKEKREKLFKKIASTIQFVPAKRANNMIITQRRTGLTSHQLRVAIDKCQRDRLDGEHAALLLKYMPTKEELQKLAKHKDSYHSLGEAEKLLFQMAQVERLETKLSMLAFMGLFDELTTNMLPRMALVNRASTSVRHSTKLSRVFEIILAFGNYMNSSKRGYVLGFKLESLSKMTEVKSTDKATSLLHYIVELVETKHPDVGKFYEELEIDVPKGVSYQAIASDIHGLRKGIDLLKYEREKQPDNTTVEAFLRDSSATVAELWDYFKKMETSYRLACMMFGENYKTIEPDELFKYLMDFCAAFKQASFDNYKASHPDEFTTKSPLSTPRQTQQQQRQIEGLAEEAAKAARDQAKQSKPVRPADVKLKPVSAKLVRDQAKERTPVRASDVRLKPVRVFRSPSDPKRKSETADVTYDEAVVRQSFREPSHVYSEVNGDIVLGRSSSTLYKAQTQTPEPIYSSVIKKPSVKDSEAGANKKQEKAYSRKGLPRTPFNIGSVGKRRAPPTPAETTTTSDPQFPPTSNIYEEIPTVNVPNSSMPNGGTGSIKRLAPPPPGRGRGPSKGLADRKERHNAAQLSEALASLDRVVNSPLWSTDEVVPEMTQNSKL